MPDALAASRYMIAQSKVGKTGTNQIIQHAEYCNSSVYGARRKVSMTTPPVQGIASFIVSHGAVSISRGEAVRSEADEMGMGLMVQSPVRRGTKALTLQAGCKEQVTNFKHGKE